MADKNDQNDQKCGNKTEEFNIRKEDNIDIKRIKKKQDTKDALNFTKTIILRATFLLLFCHQPKHRKRIQTTRSRFCIKPQIEFLSCSYFSFLEKKGGKSTCFWKRVLCKNWGKFWGKVVRLDNEVVQTLRSYHDFTTSTIARDKEAIHSGGKNEASKSTGLIDKSVTRIDLIAWWHSGPRETGRLCTGFSSLAVPMHTTVHSRSKLSILVLVLFSFFFLLSFFPSSTVTSGQISDFNAFVGKLYNIMRVTMKKYRNM